MDGRYYILRKLGWGAFSTVWLAHDLTQNKFVALKVQKSGENYYSAAEDEIEILDLISEKWESEEEWKSFLEKVNNKAGGRHSSCHCL
jgi:serine/threonine-protein kinase SRPK3